MRKGSIPQRVLDSIADTKLPVPRRLTRSGGLEYKHVESSPKPSHEDPAENSPVSSPELPDHAQISNPSAFHETHTSTAKRKLSFGRKLNPMEDSTELRQTQRAVVGELKDLIAAVKRNNTDSDSGIEMQTTSQDPVDNEDVHVEITTEHKTTSKPYIPPRQVGVVGSPSKYRREKEPLTLGAKLWRVFFNIKIAILLWYLFYLATSVQELEREAEMIKSRAMSSCNQSEIYCNTFLHESRMIAIKASNFTKQTIQSFLDGTMDAADASIEGAWFIFNQAILLWTRRVRCLMELVTVVFDRTAAAAQQAMGVLITTVTPPPYTTTIGDEVPSSSLDFLGVLSATVEKIEFEVHPPSMTLPLSVVLTDAQIRHFMNLIDINTRGKLNISSTKYLDSLESMIISYVEQASPVRQNLTKSLKDKLSGIGSSLIFPEPPSKTVAFCNDIDWSKFDEIIKVLKAFIYVGVGLVVGLIVGLVGFHGSIVYFKHKGQQFLSSDTSNWLVQKAKNFIQYVVQDKGRFITFIVGSLGVINIVLQLVALSVASQKVEEFTNDELRPTAMKAVAKWNAAQDEMWLPFVNGYNDGIQQVERDVNGTLSQVGNFAKTQMSNITSLYFDKQLEMLPVLGNGNSDFRMWFLKVLNCLVPLFDDTLDFLYKFITQYLANIHVKLPLMPPPDYLKVDNSTVNAHLDQAAKHVEDFMEAYASRIKGQLPFFIFLTVYGSAVVYYDVVQWVHRRWSNRSQNATNK